MCSMDNPDMVRYIFLTQEQYDSIDHNNNDNNNINNDNERKDGETENE